MLKVKVNKFSKNEYGRVKLEWKIVHHKTKISSFGAYINCGIVDEVEWTTVEQ